MGRSIEKFVHAQERGVGLQEQSDAINQLARSEASSGLHGGRIVKLNLSWTSSGESGENFDQLKSNVAGQQDTSAHGEREVKSRWSDDLSSDPGRGSWFDSDKKLRLPSYYDRFNRKSDPFEYNAPPLSARSIKATDDSLQNKGSSTTEEYVYVRFEEGDLEKKAKRRNLEFFSKEEKLRLKAEVERIREEEDKRKKAEQEENIAFLRHILQRDG